MKARRLLIRGLLGGAGAAFILIACSILSNPSEMPTSDLPTPTGQSLTLSATSDSLEENTTVEPTQSVVNPTDAPTKIVFQQASIPDPSGYRWEEVARGFDQPLDLTYAGDGSGHVFVAGKGGVINIIENGFKYRIPFLDIRGRVNDDAFETGLLGLTFHPQFTQTGFFYVHYTDLAGNTVIARFQVSADPDIADTASEMILLQVEQPYRNHNGGGLAFGPDGYLYIALGDGGSGGDPLGNGQSLDTLLGKILRIDVDSGDPYAIPPDNPFANGGGRAEIWAYGLRNPWRISFDALTGDMYIADVGQGIWEEVNFVAVGTPAGQNFGWNFREGAHPFKGAPPTGLTLTEPVAEYNQAGSHCSITGGYVYRGQALPSWQGVYLYGDYCSGVIWGLVQTASGDWQSQQLFALPISISSFGVDEQGELYVLGLEGIIYRLTIAP